MSLQYKGNLKCVIKFSPGEFEVALHAPLTGTPVGLQPFIGGSRAWRQCQQGLSFLLYLRSLCVLVCFHEERPTFSKSKAKLTFFSQNDRL